MKRLNLKSIGWLLSVLTSLTFSAAGRADARDNPPSPAGAPVHASIDTGWTLQLPEDEKVVFEGVVDFDASGPSVANMMYPAPNAGGFLVSLVTHAIILESMKGKRKSAAQEAADKVLLPYQDIVQRYTYRELMQRVLDKNLLAEPVRLVGYTEKTETPRLIRSVPIFSLTQDQTALVLDNVISISQPGAPAYVNTIRVVSTAAAAGDLIPYWTANQGENLKAVTTAMVADSLQIALKSAAGNLATPHNSYKTLRYYEGKTEKMERALLVSEQCDRLLIKTLRGWLMSVPVPRREPNPSLCTAAASANLH